MECVFGSLYTCDQAFSGTKQNVSKFHSRITIMHLYDVMRLGISKMELVNSLAEQKRSKVLRY
jgi:hypothetical protein